MDLTGQGHLTCPTPGDTTAPRLLHHSLCQPRLYNLESGKTDSGHCPHMVALMVVVSGMAKEDFAMGVVFWFFPLNV